MGDQIFIIGKENIALRLGCAKHTVLRHIKEDGLPAFRDNGPYKITDEALRQWSADYQARKGCLKTLVKS